ncbi:MAG: hypothetical protein ABSC61_07620 [Anaerolineales bacterium]
MSSKKAVLGVAFLLFLASIAYTNPIAGYFSTRTAVMETATATMFTPTATNTDTRRPTRTRTPSITLTQTRTKTKTLRPTDTPLFIETAAEGSGTPPAPNLRTLTRTGPSDLQPNRFTESAGKTKFSYVPPLGWKKVPASKSSLTSWNGPMQTGGVACTLVFNVEQSDLSAAEAAKELLDSLSPGGGVKILSQGKFLNDAGLDAYKVVIVISSQGQNLQLAVYFFQKRGFQIQSVYLRIAELNREQDSIVDQSLKTLQYE